MTLEWNLMARSDNVMNSYTNHLEWRDDCLMYYIMRSKGYQEGKNVVKLVIENQSIDNKSLDPRLTIKVAI